MNGRANVILDNLIADGKAQPMLVVMPQGHALQAPNVAPLARVPNETGMFSPKFKSDLLEEIVPLVEKRYRVFADADHRAIAGLSMGGGQALDIGLHRPDLFHWILGYSAAVGGQFSNVDEQFRDVSASSASRLRLLWISVGRQDYLFRADHDLAATLTERGIKVQYHETEGAHVWSVWRRNLNETLPMLFRSK